MTTRQRCERARETLEMLPDMVRMRRDARRLSLRAAAEEIGIPASILTGFEKGRGVTLRTADLILAWMART